MAFSNWIRRTTFSHSESLRAASRFPGSLAAKSLKSFNARRGFMMPIFAVALRNNAYRQKTLRMDCTLWYVGSEANAFVASSIAVPAKSILQMFQDVPNSSRRMWHCARLVRQIAKVRLSIDAVSKDIRVKVERWYTYCFWVMFDCLVVVSSFEVLVSEFLETDRILAIVCAIDSATARRHLCNLLTLRIPYKQNILWQKNMTACGPHAEKMGDPFYRSGYYACHNFSLCADTWPRTDLRKIFVYFWISLIITRHRQ